MFSLLKEQYKSDHHKAVSLYSSSKLFISLPEILLSSMFDVILGDKEPEYCLIPVFVVCS